MVAKMAIFVGDVTGLQQRRHTYFNISKTLGKGSIIHHWRQVMKYANIQKSLLKMFVNFMLSHAN